MAVWLNGCMAHLKKSRIIQPYNHPFIQTSVFKHAASTILAFLIIIFICFNFISCDDSINPKSEFKDRYILYLVMRGDTSNHIAILTHSYNINGLDPLTNEVDPVIKDAEIKIWGKSDVYKFRDSLKSRTDTTRYSDPLYFYYLNNFKPTFEESLTVRARLQNGILLKAVAKVPSEVVLDSVYKIPVPEMNDFTFSWQKNLEDVYFIYRAKLLYKQRIDEGDEVFKRAEIPVYLETKGNTVSGVYPTTTRNNFARYTLDALNWAMKKISEDEYNKSNITVIKVEFEIIAMDKTLTDYYSVTHSFMDSYSVRLDETSYTNVEGGLGIFAVYNKQVISFMLYEEYITSFGYHFE